MTGVSHYPERVEAVRRLAAVGEAKPLADELLEIAAINGGHWGYDGRAVTDILDAMPEQARIDLALELLRREFTQAELHTRAHHLVGLITRDLSAVSVETAELLLALAARHMWYHPAGQLAVYASTVIDAGRPLAPEAVAVIRRIVDSGYYGAPALKAIADSIEEPVLNVGEVWADAVMADLPGLEPVWRDLIVHARSATSAKPSAKWDKTTGQLLHRIGAEPARDKLVGWLALVGRPRTFSLCRRSYDPDVNELFDPFNATVLRGLIWALAHLPAQTQTARALGGLVETSLRKVAGTGPRSPKIANAAVFALSRMDSEAALAQIARLASKVTFKGTLKELNTALDKRAAAMGLTRDEVEELAVPTYGLTEVGRRLDTFGQASAETIVANGAVAIRWRNESGKAVKTVPAAVRAGHADELKQLRAAVKDVEKMLSAQGERLDRQFLAQRVWRYKQWRERYLDHPLLGTLARRLIWTVDGTACGFTDGQLRTVDDHTVVAGADAEVRLWHPIDHPVDEVLAWRAWLERIRSPSRSSRPIVRCTC